MRNLLLILLVTSLCRSQQIAQVLPPADCAAIHSAPIVAGTNMSQYAADRENALAEGNAAVRCHDYEAAFQLYARVANEYSKDARVLYITGESAVQAGRLEDAVPYLQRSLAQVPQYHSWSTRWSLMHVFLALGRWDEFEAMRVDTRKASLAGDPSLSAKEGYEIDSFQGEIGTIKVTEYPSPHGEEGTRDRFLLASRRHGCSGPIPHFDLREGGGGQFSLDYYSGNGTHTLIKAYSEKEPSYQTVRSDVLAQTVLHGLADQSCAP